MPERNDHDLITEMHAVMLGTNGHLGLCKQVEYNTRAISRLWIVISVLGASIGGGVYGVLQALLQRGN